MPWKTAKTALSLPQPGRDDLRGHGADNADLLPERTRRGPPSALFDCFFSRLLPPVPGLGPDDLRTILEDVRSKLEAEDHGLDVILETDSEKEAAGWRKVIEGAGLKHFKAEPAES